MSGLSWEDPEFAEFWSAIPGRAKHIMRCFPPGMPVKIKDDWPLIDNFNPKPLVGWVWGVSNDKPSKVLFLPIHPGLVNQLIRDERMDSNGRNQMLDDYAIKIEPEFLEVLQL